MHWQAIDGFLNLLKPPGLTSQEAVTLVRRTLAAAKAGHAGTLDPAAAGVLAVCLGKATRLADLVGAGDKAYRAEITFGLATSTLDSEGEVTARADSGGVTPGALGQALAGLVGEIEQYPPTYSAVHVEGRRLYEWARAGQAVAVPPRRVRVSRFELLDYQPGPPPRALVEVTCSRGTYVRVLAAQVGEALGTAAYLSFLLRTRAGEFGLEEALTPEEVGDAVAAGRSPVLPLDWPLAAWPAVELPAVEARRACHGGAVPAAGEGWVRLYHGGRLLAAAQAAQGWAQPKMVFEDAPCS